MVKFVSQLLWQYWKTLAWHLKICRWVNCCPWASCFVCISLTAYLLRILGRENQGQHCLRWQYHLQYQIQLRQIIYTYYRYNNFLILDNNKPSSNPFAVYYLNACFSLFPRAAFVDINAGCFNMKSHNKTRLIPSFFYVRFLCKGNLCRV